MDRNGIEKPGAYTSEGLRQLLNDLKRGDRYAYAAAAVALVLMYAVKFLLIEAADRRFENL